MSSFKLDLHLHLYIRLIKSNVIFNASVCFSRFENANNLAYHITLPSYNTEVAKSQIRNNEHSKVHGPHFSAPVAYAVYSAHESENTSRFNGCEKRWAKPFMGRNI